MRHPPRRDRDDKRPGQRDDRDQNHKRPHPRDERDQNHKRPGQRDDRDQNHKRPHPRDDRDKKRPGQQRDERDHRRDRHGPNQKRPPQGRRDHKAPPPKRPPTSATTLVNATLDEMARLKLPPEAQVATGTPTRRYGVVFYETLAAAKQDLHHLQEESAKVDQLNIVVRHESNMDDQELLKFGKIFAGAAWTLIHERRKAEGWYDTPQL